MTRLRHAPQLVAIALGLLVGIAAWQHPPVLAHSDVYGWTNCSWGWKSSDVRVRWDQGGFPANSVRTENGVTYTNSFINLIREGIATWNTEFGRRGIPVGVVETAYVSADVNLFYQTYGTQPRGVTFLDSDAFFECPTHATSPADYIYSADIWISVRPVPGDSFDSQQTYPGWFTQTGLARRQVYESCVDPAQNAYWYYTCDKKYDFGSSITHELGHALGYIPHPQIVDGHLVSYASSTSAKCDVTLDQATMCPAKQPYPGGPVYRTHRRTLDAWDWTSLQRISDQWWP